MAPPNVVFIGGVRVDHIIAASGEKAGPVEGGNCLFAAAGARLWGITPAVVTRVRPPWPDAWTTRAAKAGINMDAAHRVSGSGGLSSYFRYDEAGHRFSLARDEWIAAAGSCLGEGAGDPVPNTREYEEAHVTVTPRGAEVPDEFWEAPVLGFLTAPLVNQEDWLAFADRHERGAVRHPLVLLDPYSTYMRDANDSTLQRLFTQVDIVLPSQAELTSRYPDETAQAAAFKLTTLGARNVIVKLGAGGSIVTCREGSTRVPAFPVNAKDPTGAGDAFAGGLAAGWVETGDVVQAALYGTVSASFVIEDFGFFHALGRTRCEAGKRLAVLRQIVGTR
jgi:sugar/nucleoside kinase (ribokinase family)